MTTYCSLVLTYLQRRYHHQNHSHHQQHELRAHHVLALVLRLPRAGGALLQVSDGVLDVRLLEGAAGRLPGAVLHVMGLVQDHHLVVQVYLHLRGTQSVRARVRFIDRLGDNNSSRCLQLG